MFIAGPPERIKTKGSGEQALVLDDPEESLAAWQGKKGAWLWAVSTKQGEKLAECKLDTPPVFDGMAAANRRLYLTTTDGNVLCFGE